MTGAVWLTEADVAETVTLPDAVDAGRAALIAEHEGSAQTMAKTALAWDGGHTLHALGGLDRSTGLVAAKTWAHTAGGAEPVLAVWDAETGRLVAMIEAFALGQLRTAAVSAVAIEAMAAPDASTVAIIGTGKQALPQVAAALDRRAIAEVRVFSPTPAHREAFAERLRPHVATVVCDAAPTADIVITATRARQPVLHRVPPGALVVAVGAITPERAELDGATEVVPLSAVVAGSVTVPGAGHRVFKAMGLGLADLAVAGEVLRRAAGRGVPIADRRRAAPRWFT